MSPAATSTILFTKCAIAPTSFQSWILSPNYMVSWSGIPCTLTPVLLVAMVSPQGFQLRTDQRTADLLESGHRWCFDKALFR